MLATHMSPTNRLTARAALWRRLWLLPAALLLAAIVGCAVALVSAWQISTIPGQPVTMLQFWHTWSASPFMACVLPALALLIAALVIRYYAAHPELTLKRTGSILLRHKWLYFMLIPGALFYAFFKFMPLTKLIIVFEEFLPPVGIAGSRFVGLDNFTKLFSDRQFARLFSNTLILAVYNMVFYFPVPLALALLLNELRAQRYKRTVQSLLYLPHFLSWTVLVSLVYIFFSPSGGIITDLIRALGATPPNLLASPEFFRPMVIIELIWKEAGWGTIIYLAALSGVDDQIYEAALIDGASRMRQLWHITLPSIRGTIITLLILRMGTFMDTGYEQLVLMVNSLNRQVGEVFDTFVFYKGIQEGFFSYTSAVGIFKAVVSLVLVLSTNRIAKWFDEEGIY